jgi:hypothetical protein
MKQQLPDDFELFYQELPQSDYLDNIEVDDDVEDSVEETSQGLSEEQVSEIARDSLDVSYPNVEEPARDESPNHPKKPL